jgi:hypothetical protein
LPPNGRKAGNSSNGRPPPSWSIAFLVVIGQGFLFYRLFDDVHPVLGYAYIVVLR